MEKILKIKMITFVFACLIWLVDFITTVIGLTFGEVHGIIESNPIASSMFSVGIIGYIANMIFVAGIFYFMCFIVVDVLVWIYKKLCEETIPIGVIFLYSALFAMLVVDSEIPAIINNIIIIISLI